LPLVWKIGEPISVRQADSSAVSLVVIRNQEAGC
jgi:hypothetical protein